LDGIIPLSWTLDTVGPLARQVRDVGAAWDVCAGKTIGKPQHLCFRARQCLNFHRPYAYLLKSGGQKPESLDTQGPSL
jgi:Asp-tRNA(Asn)/Glu-tRNA(Gln) amidotransferase A subunit family amidase